LAATDAHAGIKRIREGIAMCQAGDLHELWTGAHVALAEAWGRAGQPDDGLSTAAAGIRLVNETGERQWESELCRIQGELMALAGADGAQIEACLQRALEVARREDIVAHKGTFVAVAGPNLETRAEYRFLRAIGGDVVGMSTVPEVIVAVHAGLRVLGLSIVTDMCLPDALQPANIDHIIAVANDAQPRLTKLVLGTLAGEPVKR